jgi:hypothetical protein
MSESDQQDAIEEPMVPTETPHPDRREHAKTPHRLDDDELARRAQHEREQTGAGGPADA